MRIFNGRDGEWLAEITAIGKKDGALCLTRQIRAQGKSGAARHLLFAPVKKQRMDVLIEKAVELGVSDLHPVLTNRTENRKINAERLEAQMIEAAEQCERLDVPRLHPLVPLAQKIAGWTDGEVYACLERADAPLLHTVITGGGAAFLIGPEGGFDAGEIEFLSARENVRPVSLGANILRAETAAIACLSYVYLNGKQ